MLTVYAKLSSHLLTVPEREREAVHMQGTVYLARLKIVPTTKNLYHIQYQCVGELSSLVNTTLTT